MTQDIFELPGPEGKYIVGSLVDLGRSIRISNSVRPRVRGHGTDPSGFNTRLFDY